MNCREDERWPEWMRIDTAADYTEVNLRTVKLWIELGLPCTYVGKTPSRIKRSDLDQWMLRRTKEEHKECSQSGAER